MDIKDSLKQFGLDEKEIALYMAGLGNDAQGMSELAKKANIKRSTAYIIYKSLEEKGLMGSIDTTTGKRFESKDPNVFISRADILKKKALEVVSAFALLANKNSEKPRITYYEGKESYRIIMEESIKKPNITLRHIGSIDSLHNVIDAKYDRDHYVPTRIAQNILLKALYFPTKATDMKIDTNKKQLRKIKWLPEAYRHNTTTLIYEDTVVISTSPHFPITVVIKSKEIAESEKQKFDLIWDLIK